MKLLLCNDDGIEAPGIAALLEAARSLGDPVMVAPAGAQSAKSHAVTIEGPLRMEERAPGQFAVHGTPADCARVGLMSVARDAKWVLSGINHGGNLGADLHYSGTVAAVREAVLHGWPGVALSHYHRRELAFDWPRASRWVVRVLAEIFARPMETGLFYNVNLPHLEAHEPDPEIVYCALDPHPLPLTFRHGDEHGHVFIDSDYQLRQRAPGADVDVCFGGAISVTPIRLF